MSAQLLIPKKKIPLPEATDTDLKYWVGRISKDLDENPTKQYADRDRTLLSGMRAELSRRRESGAAPGATAGPPPAKRTALATVSGAAISRTAPAATALSLERIANDPQAVTTRLAEMSDAYHLVSPATAVDALPPGFGVAISVVRIDPSPAKDGPGDVVSIGNKLMLSANSLARVAAAAGVDWDPTRSGRLDSGRDPHYCHYRAVGFVRNFDGSVRTLTGEVEMDAREGSPQIEEIREKARKRKDAYPDDPNDGGDSQILELRKFLLRHAERKAKNRAIVDMGVKRSYTREEIQRPFAVARLMWTGQSDDPELRREFARMGAERMLAGTAALYGAQQAPALPPPAPHHLRPMPQFVGREPPPVGTVMDDPSDYGGFDAEGDGEEVSGAPLASAPTHAAVPAVEHGVPEQTPEWDRGDNADNY